VVVAGSILPRVSQPAPIVLCDNSITLFDYTGGIVSPAGTQSGISVAGLATYTNYNTSSGPLKATIAIRTRHHSTTNAPIIEIGIWPANTNESSINWVPSNALRSGLWGGSHTSLRVSSYYYNASGNKITDSEVSIAVSKGWQPTFQILRKAVGGTDYSTDLFTKVSTGCTGNQINIYAPTLKCESDELKLSVQELEYNHQTHTFSGVGQEYYLHGGLTTTEKIDLGSTPGLNISAIVSNASRSQNGSTISFQPESYYQIKLIYASQGSWFDSYKFIQINGEDWDLVLKDNVADNGQEPIDPWTRDVYKSPDLWNRLNDHTANAPNNNTEEDHEDPDYVDVPNNTNKIFYRVTNVGCQASPADVPLRLFWTRARTDERWDEHWIFSTNNIIQTAGVTYPAGSEITIQNPTNGQFGYSTNTDPNSKLPSIAAGQTYVPNWQNGVDWFPPNNSWYEYSSTGPLAWTQEDKYNVICLLGKISESLDDVPGSIDPVVWQPYVGTEYQMPSIPVGEFVANNNNVNTKNTVLTEKTDFFVEYSNNDWDYGYATVWVNNPEVTTQNVDICFENIENTLPTSFLDYGEIYIGLTDDLWASWLSNGGTNLTNAVVVEPGLFMATNGSNFCINDIDVLPGSQEQVGVKFYFKDSLTLPTNPERYYYELEAIDRGENPALKSKTIFITDVPTTRPSPLQTKRQIAKKEARVNGSLGLATYPNPTKSTVLLQVSGETDAPYAWNLLDAYGVTIKDGTGILSDGFATKTLNVEGLRAGVYFIEVTSNQQSKSQRVVVYN
jgi:hypothetical protein